jgi:hypothetical protein
MFDNIDSFVALSRENATVTKVVLFPFDSDAGNYEFWDKVGHIVGNLMELKEIHIYFLPFDGDDDYDDDDHIVPDWETLARILPYVRHKISLCKFSEYYDVEDEDI